MIMGPIGTVLGFLEYKTDIYHLLFTKNYVYGKMKVKAGKEFEIIFPLIHDERHIIETLWNKFFKVNKKDFKKKFLNELGELDFELYINEVAKCNDE